MPQESVPSATAAAEVALSRIAADRSHAVVLVDPDRSIAEAEAIDAARAAGDDQPLAGVAYVVKDNVDVAGQVTAAGSHAHDGRPAAHDAEVVARLRAAGAVLVGRANMDELAMGASTQTSVHGPTRNPRDRRRSPGGSSGGSAAAVAAGLVPLAVGTDTGGSIAEPASQCHVLGLVPSPGLVPFDGVLPLAPSLDRVGPLTESVALTRTALAVMAGRPSRTARPLDLSGTRVAVVDELSGGPNHPEALSSLEVWTSTYSAAGGRVHRVSVPDGPRALAAYMVLASHEALGWLEPWVASGRAGDEVLRRFDAARRQTETEVAAAQGVRDRLRAQVADALAGADVLVCPTMPTAAPLLFCDHPEVSLEELADPMGRPYTDCWTVVTNLAGVPSLSVPVDDGAEAGAGVGVMLLGRPGADDLLLDLAEAVGPDLP